MQEKKTNCHIIAGCSFTTAAVGGACLLAGPVGVVVGSILIGSGLSGGMNAIQQADDETKPDFDTKKFLT